jgi:uncharacterized membrane protein
MFEAINRALATLEAQPFAQAIAGGVLFPWIESAHVLAAAAVVGTVAIVDIRLLGWRSEERTVRRMSVEVLPYTWTAFAIAAASGFLMFASSATTYAANGFFLAKVGLLILAALNMLVFHFIGYRNVAEWDSATRTPVQARLAGSLSLVCWIGVLATGRWIGFS